MKFMRFDSPQRIVMRQDLITGLWLSDDMRICFDRETNFLTLNMDAFSFSTDEFDDVQIFELNLTFVFQESTKNADVIADDVLSETEPDESHEVTDADVTRYATIADIVASNKFYVLDTETTGLGLFGGRRNYEKCI